ncbi:helix-turn-helix domain-containing protein [Aquipuribacter sp. SD81]|uniref:helix-turn-helix domain-containing protein n=1 Tax=Aquipuribacter sp. SD81 TaxID=3127703 RepID=UPI00301684AE
MSDAVTEAVTAVGGAVGGARTRVGDLGGFLREQRQQARMSLRQLADAAGVSNPYLSQVERGLRRPSAEVLQQIAKGLEISAEALYVRAGLLEQAEASEVPAAVAADPHLSERQKRVLLDVYASFVTAGPAEAPPAERAGTTGTTPDIPRRNA